MHSLGTDVALSARQERWASAVDHRRWTHTALHVLADCLAARRWARAHGDAAVHAREGTKHAVGVPAN